MITPARSIYLPPAPESIKRARQFVHAVLSEERWASATEAAVLMVSELTTNAILHSASPVDVSVDMDGEGPGSVPGTVRISVADADTGPIVTRASTDRLGEGGRGIFLVDRLSDSWGTEHTMGHKSVWFTLHAATAGADTEVGAATEVGAGDAPRPALAEAGFDPAASAIGRAQQRMSTLVIAADLERNLTAEEQITELLDRVVTALDANGGTIESRGLETGIGTGRRTGDCSEVPLTLGGQSHGHIAIYSDRQLDTEAMAFLRVAGERLAVTLAANSMVSAARERQGTHEFLSQATELLAGAATLGHTLSLAVQMVVPTLAEWSVAYSIDERGVPEVVTAMHTNEDRIDSILAYGQADATLAELLRTAAREVRAVTSSVSLSSFDYHLLVVPLTSRAREASGMLLLGTRSPLDPPTYAATLELGRRVGMAADNARLREEVSAAAAALQASLLPPILPKLDHLLLGARYRASTPALAVGGDFYDAFALPDGSAVLAIGDVCGRGATAAAATRTTRDLLRLMLSEGWATPAALRRLNQVLLEDLASDRFCTVAVARITPGLRPGTARGCVCLAGHPALAIVRADGTTEFTGEPGSLLGILPDEVLELPEVEFDLWLEDSLVLYTDGVTEARRGADMFGPEGLTVALRELGSQNPQSVADAVEAAAVRFTGNTLRDDMAVLVAQLVS